MLNEESDALVPDPSPLTPDESADLRQLAHDLFGTMLSVTVEADPPVPAVTRRLAGRIRTGIGERDCRIQFDDSGRAAVIGPISLDGEDPQAVLRSAMSALGGTWEDPVVTETEMGPVAHCCQAVAGSPQETGVARVHLWAGSACALIEDAWLNHLADQAEAEGAAGALSLEEMAEALRDHQA